MPRDITHIILADEAAEVIKSREIFDNLNAFHMGCVSDDAFLYSLSPQLSSKLHGGLGNDTRAVVLEMMDQQRKEKNPDKASEEKAFICGYVCHMAADAVFHPLIYSISGYYLKKEGLSEDEIAVSKARHRHAETCLDLLLMKGKRLSFKNFRSFRKIVADIAMRFRLDDFFTDSLQSALKAKKYTWGDNFDLQAQFHNSTTRQYFVNKITQNRTAAGMMRKLNKSLNGGLKLYTAGFYDLAGDVPQSLFAGSFIHPITGEKVEKSIADLEKEAVKCSVDYIRAVDDYIKSGIRETFVKAVPNINLDSGITATGEFSKENELEGQLLDEAKERVRSRLKINRLMTSEIKEGMAKTTQSGYGHISRAPTLRDFD